MCNFLFFTSLLVKKLAINQDLQAYAHDLWGLLPAFCRHPTDTYQNIGPLTETLIRFLKKDSFMHESIAVALQVLSPSQSLKPECFYFRC
jgi:ribosomal RNA-processing protein 12